MRVEVKFGTQTLAVELPDDPAPPTLLQLKEQLCAQTGVLPAMQKLLGKPKLNDPDSNAKSLEQLGVRNNTRLMLVGSSVTEVVSVNTASAAQKRQEEEREKLLRNLPLNIWLLPSFAGLMADPYVEGKGFPLEGGGVGVALLTLDVALFRINTLGVATAGSGGTAAALLQSLGNEGQATISHPLLRQLTAADRQAIQRAHGALRRCYYFTQEAEQAQTPEQVLAVVKRAVSLVDGLAVGEWLLLPGGWNGMNAANAIYLLIRRRGQELFDVVVVNRGHEGMSYHPSWQTAEKVVSCPILRFDEVASARLLDHTFWLLLLSLWMRSNVTIDRSEFIREEVFYDVLLPWLVEKGGRHADPPRFATEMLLGPCDSHADEDDNAGGHCFPAAIHEHRATVACSASSAIKGAVTAFVYLLEQYGVRARPVQKSIKYALKYEFMMRAAEDLSALARRFVRSHTSGLHSSHDDSSDDESPADLVAGSDGACLLHIRRAMRQMRLAGVEDTMTSASMDDVCRTARAANIVLKDARSFILTGEHFKGKTVLVYCGGLQEPSCKEFSALLAEATPRLLGAMAGVEILFLSCDLDLDKYEQHASMFTFARAAYPCTELLRRLDIGQIPELLLFSSDGRLVHRRGVAALRTDPEARLFPRGPWSGATPLTAVDVAMLRCGAAQLAHHTKKRLAADGGALTAEDARRVLDLLSAVQQMVDALPKEPQATRSGLSTSGPPEWPVASTQAEEEEEQPFQLSQQRCVTVEESAFANASLLPFASTAAYYGQPLQAVMPELKDLSDVRRVTGWSELDVALGRAVGAVEALWLRARHSGTTSRVAIQMHIIEIVSRFFLEIVPLPLPRGTDVRAVPIEEQPVVSSFYTEEPLPEPNNTTSSSSSNNSGRSDAQTRIQESIYSLVLSYTTAWQAVEVPTRAFDSERCLVAMAMLVVYDAVARRTGGSGQCSFLASLLESDGGYYLSTSISRQSLPFASASATLELVRPHFLLARSAILRYIAFQQRHYTHELFDLRMSGNLEIRKGSVTVEFLRRFLDHCGYSLHDAGSLSPAGSEMDMLMQWFCGSRTPLARNHPEFGRLRDMVLLTKFLATMETRDAQLLRRRKETDEYATWRLTFDEDAPGRQMSAGWRTTPSSPEWACVLVRGRDNDIADIVVKGFGDRELLYDEGLVLQSPIDVSILLSVEHPTEDDVLHATSMPTFEGTMSEEESEILLSCLTVPYVRLPLVLDFFASQDRHAYLFTSTVQNVFRAVIFEPSVFVSPEALHEANPTMVPMRLTEQQRRAIELRHLRGDFSVDNFESCLGTTYGLLLNELRHSPASVLDPLRRILESVLDIGPSSVYSANAPYVLFIVGVVCDVLAFCTLARGWPSLAGSAQGETLTTYQTSMLRFLLTTVRPILKEWCREGEGNDDTPTQCVLHSYLALIHRAAWRMGATTEYLSSFSPSGHDDGEGGRQCNADLPSSASGTTASHQHLVSLLESCAFVRARHSFGMGMQRTLLTAQEGDSLLSPEEKLQRFLQAQGLDTSRSSKNVLEQGQQLMLSGGRRRAVFLQIRGRYHNDTVRLPNLFRSDARSTTESRQLKLPPADVPENVIFSYMLEESHTILGYLQSLSAADLSALFRRIVRVVLRDYIYDTANTTNDAAARSVDDNAPSLLSHGGPDAARRQPSCEETTGSFWELCSPGVYRGPAATNLLFHVHTCELFWRNDELKPVPDSMSHFTDFETILGHDVLQCGLVMRHEHRHWVRIVGTPFDVIEWTAPSPLDQGVHCPLVLQGDLPQEPALAASYDGMTFDRVVDVYDEAPWPVRAERWAVDIVRAVLRETFPANGMKYFPVAEARADVRRERQGDGAETEVRVMRFIMNDSPQYKGEEERATWKELIAYKHPVPHFHVFNLVSHARKMYRSLVFTSNLRYCLHSLPLVVRPRQREQLHLTAFQAGDLMRRVRCESCIEIHRYNTSLNLRELYLPARLLQGLLPSALLEAFLFWQDEDEDTVIRGYAMGEAQDYWFNYALEVRLRPGRGDCVVMRLDDATRHRTHAGERRRGGRGAAARNTLEGGDEEAGEGMNSAQVALVRSALMRLSDATCRWLLRRVHGDVAAAIQWASDSANYDAVAAMEEKHRRATGNEELAGNNEAAEEERGRNDHAGEGTFGGSGSLQDFAGEDQQAQHVVLLNLLQNPALSPLLQLLTKLEDCSHVLVWGRVAPRQPPHRNDEERECEEDASTLADVVSIELPRLRAKFQPHVDTATGQLRLHLVDHPGWYVAEADDMPPNLQNDNTGDFLQHLRRPFQECLTLCNNTNGFALMVPNHDFTAMKVRDDPFSPLLLFDRASLRWQEHVASPFYLFAVHPCGSFLTPPTLGAALYYAVLQCATRHYAGAMRTLESCYTDSTFSVEESFMFGLMERTLPDRFPDAHAVRLKLAHAIQYSAQELPWPLHMDLAGYLCKKRHVSQACQLTRDEILDLLRRCSKAPAIVSAQLQLWAALVKEERRQTPSSSSMDLHVSVKLKTPTMNRCGFPWERLLLYPWSRIEPQKPQRLTYEAPDADDLQETGLVKFLWEDKLLLDEESGANSKLGFYFLYCLKHHGLVSPMLFGEDVCGTLGQLLGRWFHLRHARWGRETQTDGETSVRPSWCSTVLQLLDLAPSAGWPDAVTETRLQYRMRQGVSLTESREEGRFQRTPHVLMQFYQSVNEVARRVFEQHEAVRQQRERIQLSQSHTAMGREMHVRMADHLQPRLIPTNTSMERLQLSFDALHATTHGARLGHEGEEAPDATARALKMRGRLTALFGAPLSEVEMLSSFIRGEAAAMRADEDGTHHDGVNSGGARTRLPFDLHQHAQCGTLLAKQLLERLEEDAERFAQQQRRQVHYSLSVLTRDRLRLILCDTRMSAVQDTLRTSTEELQKCITALSTLSAADAADVRELTASVLHLANDIFPSIKREGDGVIINKSSTGEDDDAAVGARVQEYRLQRIQGCRSAVPLEWLLGALLSSDMAADLRAANPFHGDIERIKAELVLLMLLANRSYMAQQAEQSVRQIGLFLELCARLRGVSGADGDGGGRGHDHSPPPAFDGCQTRLQELLQCFSVGVDVDALERAGRQPTGGDASRSSGGSGRKTGELRALSEDVVAVLEGRMLQLGNESIELLNARRHYATVGGGGDGDVVSLDPRYLLFEFIHNILLRARQVEMVRWFVHNTRAGVSRVQQMIMGQGKTTVVGPLLALILADGAQLVTQVMPTALLEQTRGILRRCFSVVVPKQIYTLQFDRSFDDTDTGGIALLQQKIAAAAKTRAILISAPECIKSVFLKAIEQMHLLETTSTEELDAVHTSADERVSAQARGLLRRTQQRSAMADAITPIIQLWQRGVLIMDEVDVLLHPLRSELNFPIGLKHPIDLSGPRWTLPIHLLDAVFFYQRGRTSSTAENENTLVDVTRTGEARRGDVGQISPEESGPLKERRSLETTLLHAIRDAIGRGYETRALQREPHLVLLDHAYYQHLLLPALLPWVQLWLFDEIQRVSRHEFHVSTALFAASLNWQSFLQGTTDFLLHPERPGRESAVGSAINANFSPFAIQLLCLAHDWIHRLLPHVLAKIDRVSFGLLQPQDMDTLTVEERERMPMSRRMMAIPFVAKDVPSRSSEFAHPDVVIGLTILAFRYEGMRFTDVKALLLQLKQDFSRQSGPKEHRPAARIYHHWLRLSMSLDAQGGCRSSHNMLTSPSPSAAAAAGVGATSPSHMTGCAKPHDCSGIPLSQLQVTDEVAVHALHHRLRYLPEVAHYYLCSHVFPRTMNFQGMKISACGHELGSSMLFTNRIGFSGTPSNLLPLDLGECFYEPGSDGRVLSVLTNPSVVTAEVLPPDWTPLRVLDHIATSHPPYHALIDAGALITNMENEDVARYLLGKLSPALFDGVVFLDSKDRQMILQRSNGLKVPVAQSGIALTRRFTFFDQVHTTGTDVKQAASVTAVVTLGKDLVFRDYAQGAYRMRGVGKGQRLRLYLIPEVLSRIHATLGSATTGNRLLDVPAWLLLNSMQMESLQFIKLCMQELANVWRKKALQYLLRDSTHFHEHPDLYSDMARCRRFHMPRPGAGAGEGEPPLPDVPLLCSAIHEFREPIAYPVESFVDTPVPFLQRLMEQMREKPQELIAGDAASQQFLRDLMHRLAASLAIRGSELTAAARTEAGMNLDSEVVHEQEAEEEQEQEAEREEQRVSVASREEECHIPWRVETLRTHGRDNPTEGSCFYPLRRLRVRPQPPPFCVDPVIQVSDNYYRESWHRAGERRLKNVFLSLEWIPHPSKENETHVIHSGLVTLAEGESLRWMMHHPTPLTRQICMALRVVSSGRYMDAMDAFAAAVPHVWNERVWTDPPTQKASLTSSPVASVERDGALLLYRFFNNDMFYAPCELAVLEAMMRDVPHTDRLQFFTDCLRARRRHRNHWDDAPVAALFVPAERQEAMRPLAVLTALRGRFEELYEHALRTPPTAKLVARLRSFHDRFTRAYKKHEGGMHPMGSSILLLPTDVMGRILHDVFSSVIKPFTPHDVEHALRYLSQQDMPGVGGPTSVDMSHLRHISLHRVAEAFPVLQEEFFQTRLEAMQASEKFQKEPWCCQVCTLLNDSTVRRCVACDSLRSFAADGECVETSMDMIDEPWACQQCTFVNGSKRQPVCSMCLSARPTSLRGAQTGGGGGNVDSPVAWECPAGYWMCSVEHGGCSKFNPNNAFYCQVCDKARPDLASLRF